jgi:hypothetical protein
VFIDGERVSPGGDFVISAHDELKLERFVTDLDSGKRFKFVRLDNPAVSDPSRKENGLIRVEFRREIKNEWIYDNYPLNLLEYSGVTNMYAIDTTSNYNFDSLTTSTGLYFTGADAIPMVDSHSTSNGATIDGSKSLQRFHTIDFDVEEEFVEISLRLQGIFIDGLTGVGNIITLDSCYYEWEPKEDITAYELALCLPCLIPLNGADIVKTLPENARRHFKEVCE